MKTRRITLTVDNRISDEDALVYAAAIVRQGRISIAGNVRGFNGRKCYCWATRFKEGGVWVEAGFTRQGNDTFVVHK